MSTPEPAARADLVWEANLGKLRADLGEAGALYAQTTGAMSEEALALAVKQDRLNRAIRNSGPESTAAKSATLAYRRELEALAATEAKVTTNVERSARAQVTAAIEQRRSLAGLAGEYRAIAASAVRGSEEQATATRLAIRAENELAAAARISGAAVVSARHRGSAAAREEQNALRFGRGAAAAGGEAGRALAFGSTAFVGGLGTVFAIKQVIDAAKNEELALALVRNALKDTGQSWTAYGGEVEHATGKLEAASGFTKHEILQSLSLLIRRTGDVKQALELMGTATDLARGRGIDLALGTGIIIRALNGQVGSLKRAGIEAVKVTENTDALRASGEKASVQAVAQAKALDAQATQEGIIAAVRAKYGQAAAAFLTTEAGKQALLNAHMKDSEAIIGRALAPAYDHLLERTAKYLQNLNETGKLQREVDHLIDEAGTFVHELGDAFHAAEGAIGPVVHLLGGVENTIKVIIGLKLAFAIRGWTGSLIALEGRAVTAFGGLAASGAAAAGKVEADAVAMDGALTRATRPREIVITETYVTRGTPGVGGPGGLGGPGGFTRSGPKGVAGRVNEYGRNPQVPVEKPPGTLGTGGAAGLLLAGLAFGESGETGTEEIGWSQKEDQYYAVSQLGKNVFKAKISSAEARKRDPGFWTKIENFKRAQKQARAAGPPPVAGTAHKPVSTIGPTKPPGPPRTSLTFALQNELLDAERTPGTADDLRVLKKQQADYVKLLAQPGLTHQNILDIKQGLNSVTSQIDSIESAAAADAKEAFNKRQRAHKQRIETEENILKTTVLRAKTPAATAKAEDALVAFYKKEAKDLQLTQKERAHYEQLAVKERDGAYAQTVAARERQLRAQVTHARAGDRVQYTLPDAKGLVKAGNIDILHRPAVRNKDGTVSSVKSTSIGVDGKEILIPEVIPDGKGGYKVVDADEAAAYYKKTGENLGTFSSVKAANAYADRLHKQQAALPPTKLQAEDALVKFLKARANDARLTQKERDHYAKLAGDEERKLKTATVKALETIPIDLQIAEQRARIGGDDDKLIGVLRKEEAALKRQEQHLRKIHAGKVALLAVLKNEASIEKEIRTLTKAQKENAGANEKQFLESFRNIISSYAPNAFPLPAAPAPGKSETHLYEAVHELRGIKGHLADIQRTGKFPASAYRGAVAEAVAG